MAVVSAHGEPPPEVAVRLAVEALSGGDIVGLPTDTVYGLAADPFHTGAADRLFRVKGRPRTVELPVLVADEAQALALCTAVPRAARRLMERYWPGPLTLVLPRRPDLVADLGEDDATIGIRCPAHPVPLAVCSAVGPIAATSANRHRGPALTTAQEVAESWVRRWCWSSTPAPVKAFRRPSWTAPGSPHDCCGRAGWRWSRSKPPWGEQDRELSAPAHLALGNRPPAPIGSRWCNPTTSCSPSSQQSRKGRTPLSS